MPNVLVGSVTTAATPSAVAKPGEGDRRKDTSPGVFYLSASRLAWLVYGVVVEDLPVIAAKSALARLQRAVFQNCASANSPEATGVNGRAGGA